MTEVCAVCGEAADDSNSAICNSCGERFHLALRVDQPVKDCGRVWINERYLALEFACATCLAGGDASEEKKEPARPRRVSGLPPARRRYRKLR